MFPRHRGLALVALLLASCTQETSVTRESFPSVLTTPAATPSTPTTAGAPTARKTLDTRTAPRASTTTIATTTTVGSLEIAQADPHAQQSNAQKLPVPQAPPDPRAPEPVVELGSIEIPRIGLDKSLFEGITLTTLDRGPGHWPGTALPGGVGNVVVGGHRTSKSRPFRNLQQLVPGDEVIFTTGAGRFVYRVVRTEIVTPDAIWIVNQTAEYTATLFACHPVGSTKERIVVFLELS